MKKNLRKMRRLKRSDKMIDQDIVPQSFQKLVKDFLVKDFEDTLVKDFEDILVKDFEDTEEFKKRISRIQEEPKNRTPIQIFNYC